MHRRQFLITAASTATVTALAGPAFAAPLLEATAERLSKTALRVQWAGSEPASIFLSTDPDMPPAATRPVLEAARGGAAEVSAAVTPRPYFLIATKDGASRVAERLLPLEGGRNFRDLGGYRAGDGRQVRWGRIYRSGVMSGLTRADMDYLGKLGIAVVCDLRSSQERQSEPSPFLTARDAKVFTFDYDMGASLRGLGGLKTRADAINAFATAYVNFVDVLTPNYTDMFARLVQGDAPLAMNCSAGKDRTGIGSAVVLSVLGVPRPTLIADYALTQVYTPPSMYQTQIASTGKVAGLSSEQARAFASMPPEVLAVIMGSDPDVMRLALSMIDQKFGGPVELAKARFGLTDAKINRLRDAYLV